jgi:hypothetical protein
MSSPASTSRFGFRVKGHQRVVATFEFKDARDRLLYRKHRIEPGEGGRSKLFLYDHPDGEGGWETGMGGRRVPYRLLDLLRAVDGEPIYMVEGEAKADKLVKWGLIATSFKDWPTAEFAHLLRGRKVFVLPDNDEPGRKQATKACAAIQQSGGAPIVIELPRLPDGGDIIDWKGLYGDLMRIVSKHDDIHERCSDTFPAPVASAGFEFVPASDLEYTPPVFLIDGILETDTLGLGFGDPASAKSFLFVDIALSVATGTDFHKRAVKQGAVFYIAGEGHNGLGRRFQAWSQHRGVPLVGAPCFVSKRSAQFLDEASAKAVTDAIAQLAARHGSPTLIIIDTLARNFGPGDENSNTEMGKFVGAIDTMRARFPGCVVLIVHHTGHGAKHRARGAMALLGALDCEYRVEKSQDLVTLVNTKMKDATQPPALAFRLENVELGNGASSAVLVEAEVPAPAHSLTTVQKLARDTYISAAFESSRRDNHNSLAVHVDDWRSHFHAKHTGDNDVTKRQAFHRVRKDLLSRGLIVVDGDFYLWMDDTVIELINSARVAF